MLCCFVWKNTDLKLNARENAWTYFNRDEFENLLNRSVKLNLI